MSVAEKLQTIAENEQRVYDKGFTDGLNSAPPDYLPSLTQFSIENWNLLSRTNVVLNLPNITNYQHTMRQRTQKNTTVEHLTINGSQGGNVTNISYAFFGSSADYTLKRMTLNWELSACTQFYDAFYNLKGLEVIDGNPFDFSSATGIGNIFNQCIALKDVRVKPLTIKVNFNVGSCQSFSDETIQSIIDGLADLTGQDTKTITFHATVGEKLTDTQKATITAKNWTLAY